MTDADLILCELLVLRCQRKDVAAAEEMVKLFEKSLLYYLRRMVQSEADAWDLFQETWVSVFRALGHLQNSRALPAFLYRTARNHALAHLRRRQADLRLYAEMEPTRISNSPDPIFSPDDAAAVHAALGQLSLPHREALTLFFLQDLSIDEIALVLAIPPGTVKSRLHYAKYALKSILCQGASDVATK